MQKSQRSRWETSGGKGVLYAIEPDVDGSRYRMETEEQAIEDKYHCDEMLKIVKQNNKLSNQRGKRKLTTKPPSVEYLKIRQAKARLKHKDEQHDGDSSTAQGNIEYLNFVFY